MGISLLTDSYSDHSAIETGSMGGGRVKSDLCSDTGVCMDHTKVRPVRDLINSRAVVRKYPGLQKKKLGRLVFMEHIRQDWEHRTVPFIWT